MSGGQVMLIVTSFGGFSISAPDPLSPGGAHVTVSEGKGHSNKSMSLIEYLIFSGRDAATFEELIELLWPDGGPRDPLASLRLLIHRTRAELDSLGAYSGADLILLQDGAYCLNREIPMQSDVQMFDELYKKSREGRAAERLDALMAAAELYKGRFLPKSSQYQWAMTLNTYYHLKYLSICEEAVGILESFERHWDIIELCKKAVAIDPYAETLHVAFIKALTKVGSCNIALEHYKNVTTMLMDEFGITPSKEFSAVYSTLAKSINALEDDIGVIRSSLTDESGDGALFVEYEIFKQMYWLKSRESMRSGQVVQLVLISAYPTAGKKHGKHSKRICMERLGEGIHSSLRQGDLYTRYSVMQYLVLLQSANHENGELVLERIQRCFKSSYSRPGYLLQCSMLPLLPKSPGMDITLTTADLKLGNS